MSARRKGRPSGDEPPYSRYAFLNPYNLTLLAGVGTTAAATGHWWMAICGAAAEGLWMLFAPDSKILRQAWFDKTWAAEREAALAERRLEKWKRASPPDQARFQLLADQKKRIEQLAADNPSLTTELLADELPKLELLLDDFLELATTCARAERHLASFDFQSMERSWRMYTSQVQQFPGRDPRREVAEKNLEVLKQRRRRWEELQRTLQTTRGQMDLMEQTFRLLADDIVTATPGEIGGRLEELRVGVEAIRESATDEDAAYAELDEAEAIAAAGDRRAR